MGRISAVLAVLLLAASAGLLIGQEGAPPKQDPSSPAPAKQDPPKQDPPAETPKPAGPQPAPSQDDKVAITSIIETWLKFVQGEEHRGYLHEKISPVMHRVYRYEYVHEGDLDMSIATEAVGESHIVHWSWHINAQLTENFDPYRLEGSANVGGAQWKINVRTVEDKRVVEVTLPQSAESPTGDVRRTDFEGDQAVGTMAELIFYKLRQRGDLAKPGRVPFRIAGAAGATEIGLTFRVEEPVMKDYLGQKAFVTPVTVEGAPSDSQLPIHFRAFVDKYGRIVEATGREESMRFVIAKDASDARGGEFTLSARGRRDPFNKYGAMTPLGRTSSETASTKEKDTPVQINPTQLAEEVAKCGQLIEKLEQFVRETNPGAETVYQAFLKRYEAVRRACAGDPVKLNTLDGYKAKAEQIYGGAEKQVRRAMALLEQIEDFYRALDDKGVEKNIEELKRIRARKEFFQDERIVEMDRIIKQAEQKLAQTKARLELRDKILVLTGTVSQDNVTREKVDIDLDLGGTDMRVSEFVRVVHRLTFAVVNDKLYREREEVEGQGVMIEKIQPHGIQVSYKGELREVGLKKRESKEAKKP